ncbi:hypothetical protein B0A48_12663 [Cryoendolithus antarcticus]|uniref:SprT-like domain-containing protein n=1 Tax=Cryoendolithus antarcticus TaxID=1507870 RepID=A0A1V8SR24_9PEZI|nr:hypothetical protein B0A48_12663 [Cryoendolithus antarcticus]
MARLRRISDSDDDFVAAQQAAKDPTQTRQRTSPRKRVQQPCTADGPDATNTTGQSANLRTAISSLAPTGERKKQIRLSPLKCLSGTAMAPLRLQSGKVTVDLVPTLSDPVSGKASRIISPRKRVLGAVAVPVMVAPEISAMSVDEVEIEESIWCGSDASSSSDSEDELPSPRKLWPMSLNATRQVKEVPPLPNLSRTIRSLQDLSLNTAATRDTKPPPRPLYKISIDSRPSSLSDKENLAAILRFSPPRLHSPSKERHRRPSYDRPVTPPPSSPTKSKLVSPSKARPKIPTPPHRQSLDGFWNADTVNDWNDQYSPQKVIMSPRKNRFIDLSSTDSPSTSPKKSSSPAKRSKKEMQVRREFESRKHKLAEDFLFELDQRITHGQISTLSATTGGVKLLWSKTLNTTAGRANWRRETTKTRLSDGTTQAIHKHHASIELASKVIDSDTRLYNVLAHEFCHLANFMVSGIKDQPHGTSFKTWGRKVTLAFEDRGVEVTTKHSYEIEYKYVWQCSGEECETLFQRHSKSIDVERQRCGNCRGRLVQVKPAPRGGTSPVKKEATGYAGFVKTHFADVKKSLPGVSHREIMEAVGKKYRSEKEAKLAGVPVTGSVKVAVGDDGSFNIDDVADALEVIVLDD